MIRSEPEIGKTDPLTGESRKYAEEHGGLNIHQAAAEIDAQAADPDTLPGGMKDARADLQKAEAQKEKAEAKLRQQIQHQNTYANFLESILVLKGEINTAQLALAEYQFTLKNSTANFETWPFWVRQSGNRFGGAMRDFATSISTAKELIPLLEPWIESAKKRLASLENSAAAFKEKHKLE